MGGALLRRAILGGAVAAAVAGRAGAQAADRVLRVVAPWEVRGLSLARGGFVFQRLSVAETLVASDAEGGMVPLLASSWSASPSGLQWRFPVRPGRVFHDGAPVTAAAAAQALGYGAAAAGSSLAVVPVAVIEAEGEAVLIRLRRPFAALLGYLASYGALVLAPSSYAADGTVRGIVGSGPYRVTRMDGTLVVETEAVAPVAAGGPAVRRVRYTAVADGETRARMVESGDADLALNLQPVAADRLRRGSQAAVVSLPIPRARFVALNVGLPVFADVRVRQALSLSVDRQGAARAILRNPAAAADQLLPPFLQAWRDPATPPLRTDPAAAARLLDEAGWRPGPDGVRAKDDVRLAFELFTYAVRPELPPLAEAMQAGWRDLGIEARIRLGDSEEIPQLRATGRLEAALVARNYGLIPDPVATLAEDFLPPASLGYASIGWRSAAVEDAIRAYFVTTDPAEQTVLRHRITATLQAELPVLPHSWYDQVVAFSRRVENGTVDPYEASYGIPQLRWAAA